MEDPPPRVLIYLMRHDIRLSDNPIFHAASASASSPRRTTHPDTAKSIDAWTRDKSSIVDQSLPHFTHLLPVYVFPADVVEVSGFLPDSKLESPYPQARSQVAGLWRTGPHRAKFVAEGVWDLKKSIEKLGCGAGLEIRVGRSSDVLQDMLQWYIDAKSAGRSNADVAGIWMSEELGENEKDEKARLSRVAAENCVPLKIWNDEKYFIDDRDLPFDKITALPDVFTTYRKSLEPLRTRPRPCIPAPEQLPPLPVAIPPQKQPFQIPDSLNDLLGALLNPLKNDSKHDLSIPPKWPPGALSSHPFSGGESAAQNRLAHLISSGSMSGYKATRNQMLGVDYSTKLSAFLAQGHITARQIHWAMMDFEEGQGPGADVSGYGKGENDGTAGVRFELLWRDYMHLCAKKFGDKIKSLEGFQVPHTRRKSNDAPSTSNYEDRSSSKRWKHLNESGGLGDAPERTREVFARFRSGRTGIGLIDAANRELFLTGYTSNRARQNVASFLSHPSHLGIDWRIGAEWYEYLLVDYDMASNWGNWQYVAGVGNDPRQGRVFNPVKQALDYDPEGEYIKTWVPELRDVNLWKSMGTDKREIDQQRLMGLYQAWRLNDSEKGNLSLKGVDWVDAPLARIQFSVNRGKGRGGHDGGKRGQRGRGRGIDNRKGKLNPEQKTEGTHIASK